LKTRRRRRRRRRRRGKEERKKEKEGRPFSSKCMKIKIFYSIF